MKKRTRQIMLAGLMLLLISGCGKKAVVSDNSAVSGSVVVGSDSSTFVPYSESIDSAATEDISENGVSTDGVSSNEVFVNIVPTREASAEAAVSDNISLDDLTELEDGGNCLYIANMTGKNITNLSITFNAGSLNNMEILNGDTLKDGSLLTYSIVDMSSLQSESQLTLSVNAVGRDNKSMVFPEISIVDPSHMRVVLIQTEDGYAMYLQ
ncbi:MAG TPA: hypothetical protein PLQ04_03250 [Lachnospiraceae bacterium]|nr:hypothetical protein [Lachnospiraceae bacterium]